MKKTPKTFLTALAAVALLLNVVSLPAMAENWNDSHRVREGRANGTINHHEMNQIRQNRWQERNYKQRAMADGRMNGHERRRLHQLENKNDRYIFRSKHDRH